MRLNGTSSNHHAAMYVTPVYVISGSIVMLGVGLFFLSAKSIMEGGVYVSELIDLMSSLDTIDGKSAALTVTIMYQSLTFLLHTGACLSWPYEVCSAFAFGVSITMLAFGSVCLSCSYTHRELCHTITCLTGFGLLYVYYVLIVWASEKDKTAFYLIMITGLVLNIMFAIRGSPLLEYIILWASYCVEFLIVYRIRKGFHRL